MRSTIVSLWFLTLLIEYSVFIGRGCLFFFSSPGSDVVDWLYHHVEGFTDRREARKYASNLLKAGYIRHTVNKITFSEQCYYVFGDLSGSESLSMLSPLIEIHARCSIRSGEKSYAGSVFDAENETTAC